MLNATITHNSQIIAHIFSKELRSQGVKFLSPENYTLQLGLIEHPAGKIVTDHIHRQDIQYQVDTTQEFLYIEKGQVKIKLFSEEWQLLGEFILTGGDFVLLVSGGHGLEVIEECRIIEIKQGPYPGDKLAKLYRPEKNSSIPSETSPLFSHSHEKTDIFNHRNSKPHSNEHPSK